MDYVDPVTPGNYIDVKGPILTSAGEFDDTITTARIEGLADSAIQKAQINNGLVPPSAGGLNPPLPTTVVVDLFGLTEAEATMVKTRIQNSGVAESYFILLEN